MDFRPLLAATLPHIEAAKLPALVSPKLDGIRCVKLGGKALSRTLKPIPNVFVREWIEEFLPDGIDGELMLADHRTPFCDVSSAIMSRDGQPDFTFHAFDYKVSSMDADWMPFLQRLQTLDTWAQYAKLPPVRVVPHVLVSTHEQLANAVARNLAEGYEGSMLRDPHGKYKFGRSTLKEGILLKIKPFGDEEALVVGAIEQMHNTNEAKTNELGLTKRSTAKDGKVPAGVLGALACRTSDGAEFEIGTGFDAAMRARLWQDRGSLPGRVVTFKHLPPPGGRLPGQPPRHPVFLHFRED